MAGVRQKSCTACGKLHPENAMRCSSCGALLIGAPIVVVDAPDAAKPSSLGRSASADHWTCEYCHFEQNEKKTNVCRLCERGRDLPAGERAPSRNADQAVYILRFPFGDVTFDSSLAIGRDPDFCRFSERLQDFEKISRRHAILEVNAGSNLSLVDMGSMNGTYVNGLRLDQAVRATIRIGDELSFSKGLTCQIRSGE